MTREQAKELLPIIQAFAEGKTVEYLNYNNKWVEEDNNLSFCLKKTSYRIKPEHKYRPFKTKEECWNEMLKHKPFGWLKSKRYGYYRNIVEVQLTGEFKGGLIKFQTSKNLLQPSSCVFDEYTFADGTPFGIKE